MELTGAAARRYFRCRTARRSKTACPGQPYWGEVETDIVTIPPRYGQGHAGQRRGLPGSRGIDQYTAFGHIKTPPAPRYANAHNCVTMKSCCPWVWGA